ncbi:MAG: T9SS type A sorting domain-containing protein, partial [Bacteroidota bacterium]
RGATLGASNMGFIRVNTNLGGNNSTGLLIRGNSSRARDSAVIWSLAFSEAVANVDLYLGSLDNHDHVHCYAYIDGKPLPLSRYNFSIPNPAAVKFTSESSLICEGDPTGSYSTFDEAFRLRINQAVDSIVFSAFKNDGSDNNVTLFISDLSYCLASDSDGDGLLSHMDLDADDDGIPDLVETGGLDTDGNAKADCFDGSGQLADTDGDGWCDTYDNREGSFSSGTPLTILDQDLDGIPNYQDIDSDDDGITDVVESFGFAADDDPSKGQDGQVDNDTDVDFNGWSDAYINQVPTTADASNSESSNNTLVDFTTGIGSVDRDGDGLPNFLDIDSDDDGIVDLIEAQASSTNRLDIFDGLAIYVPTDADGDGLMAQFDPDEGGSYIEPINTDNTDQVDYLDENADNDSFADLLEGHDANGDGVVDHAPAGVDSDLDGLDDAFDTDLASHDPEGSNQSIQDSDNNLLSGGERDWRETGSTTFPVEWLGFEVKLVGRDALLNWETASEINSDKYQIERTLDHQTFEVVGEVKAAGTSNETRSYTFTDAGVLGLNQASIYYRIQQLDLDGGFDFSDVVELKLGGQGLSLLLSPNPTDGPLEMNWEGLSEHSFGELKITDLSGRVVFQQQVAIKDGGLETSLAQYPEGIYVVQLQLEDQVISKKVQKR